MGKVLIIGGTKGIGKAIVSEIIEEEGDENELDNPYH